MKYSNENNKRNEEQKMHKFFKSVTFWIFIVCVGVLCLQNNIEGFTEEFYLIQSEPWKLHTWVTNVFMHGDWWHLFGNMVGILSIGYMVEGIMGKRKYLILYLLTGIFGSVAQMGFHYFASPPNVVHALVGASGALCGIVGALVYYRPNTILLLFLIIPMRTITLFWVFLGIGFTYTVINYLGGDGNVAHLAHNGGLISGYFLAKLLGKRFFFIVQGTDIYGKLCNNRIYEFSELIDFLMTYRIDAWWIYGNGSRKLSQIELKIITMTADKVKDANNNNLTEGELDANVSKGLDSLREELRKKAGL